MSLDLTITNVLNEFHLIPDSRKKELELLRDFILKKKGRTNLIFICTHNSRRSHLAQIWAQVASYYYNQKGISCFSGGTESTAFYPSAIEALKEQGLLALRISEGANPIYAIRFTDSNHPILCFSKKHDHFFNPKTNFIAIMTCDQADQKCPFIPNANHRISIKYEDPKVADGTSFEKEKYTQRSREICREMFFVFSEIEKYN
ncbi:MAG: protein-tyrosine-phosphatase [Flavobacteriales bacterium]|nr:protein-tyrosine-phosphatase [Flavobacteriales bacterium]